ncbi:hypothetical protein [Kitasatospora fiedleri]|uniref:hypothetical protein n=1 Tax=Kitasatospora fiedleri TaxID=2991545 RepID=UPI00249AE838|nr:hypothetical protein [Kitasatospora fiedleri]
MARTMPAKSGDVFRAKIVRRVREGRNPEYRWDAGPDVPEWLYTGETHTEYLGPYKTRAAAQGQLTSLTHHYRHHAQGHVLREDVVLAIIERAQTVWEEVE